VIHAAGIAPGGLIQLKTREAAEEVLSPKVKGTLVLGELVSAEPPDFVVLCSSLASVVGVVGQVDYVGANAFLDAYARQSTTGGGPFTVAIGWDTWGEVGMAVETEVPRDWREARQHLLGSRIQSEEGAEAFVRILDSGLAHVVTSVADLYTRRAPAAAVVAEPSESSAPPAAQHERPELASEYVAPRTEVERAVAEIWREHLGFERVGVHDSFFDLGGHSLLATRVVNRLRETFRVPLNLESLFEAPTVAQLAAVILANEAKPGQAEETARLLRSVAEMSAEEVLAILGEPGEPGSRAHD
jgi:acyl carrier protein